MVKKGQKPVKNGQKLSTTVKKLVNTVTNVLKRSKMAKNGKEIVREKNYKNDQKR